MKMCAAACLWLAVFAGAAFWADDAVAAPQCGAADASGAVLCSTNPALDARALCNDGTQPVFWVRPGSGAGHARWVIWLQGGGECVDAPSCAARATGASAQFLTSSGFTVDAGAGVLSADPAVNPYLYNANEVLIHYCSSDDWSGAYAASRAFDAADPSTWNFQGRRIALAAVATLKQLGLGFSGARQILLGGSSAGGVGIVSVANDVLPILPHTTDIRMANDAGFVLDIGQFDATLASPYVSPAQPNAFDLYFSAGINLWHGRGDAKCDAAARTRLAHIDCYDTSVVMHQGLIDLPSFVVESRLDAAQLSRELCYAATGACPLPKVATTPQGVYAAAFSSRMAKSLKGAGAGARYAVYAPDAYMHVVLNDDAAFTAANPFPGERLVARDVFDEWLGRPTGTRIVHIASAPGVGGGVPR